MKGSNFLAASLAISLFTSTLGQITPGTNPQQSSTATDDVVRIDTNLVQVDAVVTDGSGRQVTDLNAEDFEILEDGRPQPITAFSYVSVTDGSTLPEAGPPALPSVKNAPPVPARPLSPNQVRRTIVAVVDNLGLSFQSMDLVRRTLKKFVDEQMQPGDLMAIVRTDGGASDLWRLTSDKQQLTDAIGRLRWRNFGNRVGLYALEPEVDGGVFRDMSSATPGSPISTERALEYVVRALKPLPGRKSVLFFTDDFPVLSKTEALNLDGEPLPSGIATIGKDSVYLTNSLERLVQASNEASVVIYGVDPRGLAVTSPTAADYSPRSDLTTITGRLRPGETQPAAGMTQLSSGAWLTNLLAKRGAIILNTQDGLKYLSRQTGGFAVINTNDLNQGLGRVMNDLKGYYLIGYHPSPETFGMKNGRVNYHEIKLRLKRSGLQVRSRAGFYGVPSDKVREAAPRTMEEQLIAAVNSPFTATGVRLRLTALFGNGQPGSFIRVLLHIDPRDLTFKEKPDGWHEAVIDVLASSYGDAGEVTDHIARTDTVRARGHAYARLMRNGLDYDLLVPVKRAGGYQLRAAVRDSDSGRVGTVNSFVKVPDLKKGQMTLSGITLSDTVVPVNLTSVFLTTASVPSASLKISQGAGSGEATEVQPTSSVRRFQRGMTLEYSYFIYNARSQRSNSLPELWAETRLFHEGQLVKSNEGPPIDTSVLQFDPKRLSAKGSLSIGNDLEPGHYVLQVVVTDQTGQGKNEMAWQWIDFEIVK